MYDGLRALKSLGQHFLKDPKILREIIFFAGLNPYENVIEIGPGTGALTELMLQAGHSVCSVEIDERFCAMLGEKFKGFNDFHLVIDDATKIDFSKLAANFKMVPPLVMLGNFPYNIGTKIIKENVHKNKLFRTICGVLQEEVVRRLISTPSGKDYSFLSVYCQYYGNIKMGRIIKSGSFSPPPKVRSAIFKIDLKKRRPLRIDEERTFSTIISAAFAYRRKTLVNNLRNRGFEVGYISEWLMGKGYPAKTRAQDIALDDFIGLAKLIHHRKKLK